MNIFKKAMMIGVSVLFIISLVACNKPGPTEGSGEKMDKASSSMEKMDEAAPAEGKMDEAEPAEGKMDDAAPAEDKMGEQGENVGEGAEEAAPTEEDLVSDVDITTQVKAAIVAEPALSSYQISVNVIKGVVTLSGSIASQEDIDKAVEIASSVDGVKDVDNKMVLK